ncbi:GTP cyclohydrolase I [Sinorhizobium psoraleae]|uniref:GTP cyclohydrolase I n=1 Tax=Sinorhizobium psoraleae TaxID=520838 RepID=A0ABT4KNP1_9HYPH|nr:GTP cyclohydrolase I [Sinorhizobium psoraleae]MCZ4093566.1 GTP cyclohydrolase I [Sinorhizobium psoraleae]
MGSFGESVVKLLQFVGEDPSRSGLRETPARVTRAWQFWCGGYGKDPKDILKVFEDGAEKHNQTITVQDIPIYSHCEHHLAPIFGTCTISYAPNGKIIGLSKLSRLADIFARRLQVQERMTDQIADALFTHLEPKGVGVIIKARHLCMESRGCANRDTRR